MTKEQAEDFEGFLLRKDWKNAEALIENLEDIGFESDALALHQQLNRAKAHAANEIEDFELDREIEARIQAGDFIDWSYPRE